MSDTMIDVDRDQIATDFKTMFAGTLPPETIDGAVAHLANAPQVAATAYPANGSIASLVIYAKCQCTITGGKTFDGSVWGVSFPGGGALFGNVYTDDINTMYAKTSSFALAATPVYTSFIFMDDSGNALPDSATSWSLREATQQILEGLTAREAKVLRMRFGIDMNTDHTLEEVGKQFDVTRERIRQIEAKALRKLRHPSRSETLRSFLDIE